MSNNKVKAVLGTVIPLVALAAYLIWDFWPEPEDPEKRQMAAICSSLVVPCYAANDAWGNIDGRVVVDVAGDGTVEESRYKGSAPKAVRQCLIATTKARKIDDYKDKPIRVTCQYSGSITEGTQMMSTNWKLDAR